MSPRPLSLAAVYLLVGAFAVPTPTHAATCTTLYPSNSIAPNGFEISWNPFVVGKELLLGATCGGGNLNVSASNAAVTSYIYKTGHYLTGHYLTGTAWQSYAFTGSSLAGDWYKVTAQAIIPQQTGTPCFVGYTYQQVSGRWKCGCSDTTCTVNKWQLQWIDGRGTNTIAPGEPTDKSACINLSAQGDNLANAITAAAGIAAKCVYVPSGTHNYEGTYTLDGIKLIGDEDTSVLNAPDPQNRRLTLVGTGAGLYNLKIFSGGTERTNTYDVIVGDASNWVINNVTIDGGNGAGIIVYLGHNGRITGNRIFNMKADSIHMSERAHNIYVAGNYTRNSGDDNISVVSYQADITVTHDILIENNDVGYQPDNGRGITVVGGENVTIRNNRIVETAQAGLYLASEGSYDTLGVSNVIVDNNILDHMPLAHPETNHWSILVYSGTGRPVENINITNNTITNAVNGPIDIRTSTNNIYCSGNANDGSPITPAHCTGTGAGITGAGIDATILGGTMVPFPGN